MYIIINEDGSVYKTEVINEDIQNCAEIGIVDIICISSPQPTRYHDGNWWGIDNYE